MQMFRRAELSQLKFLDLSYNFLTSVPRDVRWQDFFRLHSLRAQNYCDARRQMFARESKNICLGHNAAAIHGDNDKTTIAIVGSSGIFSAVCRMIVVKKKNNRSHELS